MPESQPDPNPSGAKSFWSTLPGVLTAVGGIIAGTAALLTALVSAGVLGGKPTATPVPVVTVTAAASTATAFLLEPIAPTGAITPPMTVTSSVGAAPSATAPLAASDALMADDFSDLHNNWFSEVTEQSDKGYEDGEFRLTVYQPEFSTWSYPDPPRDFADFALEVDARRVSGPLDNEFGVLVRYQPDTDEFYLFAISSNGFYSVQKYQANEWQKLVDWTESTAILQGEDVNRLRVTGQGDKLRFFVNGEPLTLVEDASFRSGSVGLLATANEKGGVAVAFDNLRVRPLSAP
jgi:hypothetical protein